ncbi:MAG: HAD family phosphatase [Planctomycetes bacterium]|nr:HAD family phosphatase [Planctomycetota bacterium]
MIGVIFDMDGVLVDSAEAHLRSWRQLAAEHGGSVTDQQFAATFGQQNSDIVPLLFGPVSPERLAALADRKEAIYRELVRDEPPVVAGAVELIRALDAAGAALAVGSSGPLANIELILRGMGVRSLIRHIVSGDDVTRGKPDPQVFRLACERLGLPPGACVVIEDAPVGVQAAHGAGAKAVAVLMHHPASAFPRADLVVPRLADLSAARLLALARRDGKAESNGRP